MSEKLREEYVTLNAQLKDIAKFMKQVLPEPTFQRFETRGRIITTTPSVPVKRRVVEFLPSTTAVYESTPRKPKFEIDDEEEDDVEEEVSDLGRKNFGQIASPYLKPYIYNARFLDKQYGIRREDDGSFMIGDSTLSVDDTSDISIQGRHFKGTRGYGGY